MERKLLLLIVYNHFSTLTQPKLTSNKFRMNLMLLKNGKKTLPQSYQAKDYEQIPLQIVEIWYNETNLNL